MDDFETRIQVEEIRPEVDEEELRSLARELADWLEYQLYSREAANSTKDSSLKN